MVLVVIVQDNNEVTGANEVTGGVGGVACGFGGDGILWTPKTEGPPECLVEGLVGSGETLGLAVVAGGGVKEEEQRARGYRKVGENRGTIHGACAGARVCKESTLEMKSEFAGGGAISDEGLSSGGGGGKTGILEGFVESGGEVFYLGVVARGQDDGDNHSGGVVEVGGRSDPESGVAVGGIVDIPGDGDLKRKETETENILEMVREVHGIVGGGRGAGGTKLAVEVEHAFGGIFEGGIETVLDHRDGFAVGHGDLLSFHGDLFVVVDVHLLNTVGVFVSLYEVGLREGFVFYPVGGLLVGGGTPGGIQGGTLGLGVTFRSDVGEKFALHVLKKNNESRFLCLGEFLDVAVGGFEDVVGVQGTKAKDGEQFFDTVIVNVGIEIIFVLACHVFVCFCLVLLWLWLWLH